MKVLPINHIYKSVVLIIMTWSTEQRKISLFLSRPVFEFRFCLFVDAQTDTSLPGKLF